MRQMPRNSTPVPPQASRSEIFREQLTDFYGSQVQAWPLLATHAAQLDRLATRELTVDGTTVLIQCNPERKANQGDLSPAAAAQRKCFLDMANLPPQEKVLPHDGMLWAPNPRPILSRHCTVIYPEHTDQRLGLVIAPLLRAVQSVGQKMIVFYNGPLVGASAPDHAHFQAGAYGSLPIEADIHRYGRGEPVLEECELSVYLPHHLGRSVLLFEGSNTGSTGKTILAFAQALPVRPGESEPRLNIVARGHEDGTHTIYVFPRSEFRPSYFTSGGPKISPASLEMAGLMITADQADFAAVTPDHIRQLWHDTSLGHNVVRQALKQASATMTN